MQRLITLILFAFSSQLMMGQVYGEPIIQWDFAEGIPDDWENASEDGVSHWEYRGPATEPDNTVCSLGSCGATSLPPQSETLENGFVIFDSNYWDDTTGPCGANIGSGIAPGPHTASLTTGTINLSGQNSVALAFRQQFRQWFGVSTKVQVSVAGGEWTTIITNSGSFSGNVVWGNADLSALAGGQNDVRLRFLFTGLYFWWCLDDITLFIPNQNDLLLTQGTYTNYNPVIGTGIENLEYQIYPQGLLTPFELGGKATNVGALAQSNVVLTVEVLNANQEVVHTQSGTGININPSQNATLTAGTYLPALPNGAYDLRFAVDQTQTDEDPQNNSLIKDFELSDYTYGRDEGESMGEYTPVTLYANSAFEMGCGYEIPVAGYQLNSIAVALSDSTLPGSLVYGIIYDEVVDTILAQTLPIEVNQAWLNSVGDSQWMTIPLNPPLSLLDGQIINAQVGSYGGEDQVRVCYSGSAPASTCFLKYPVENQLFYLANTPMVRINVFPAGTTSGCTDPAAQNYSALAMEDDGSCQYPGCTIDYATNYDPSANFEDGSCQIEGCANPEADNFDPNVTIDVPESCIFLGCTNPDALNYDPQANEDDGSCQVEGCTDPTASNYNPEANIEDGSCLFLGCTDPEADNFDPFANEDDGSCIYLGCTDPLALNYDETANTDDGSCEYDGAFASITPSSACVPFTLTVNNQTQTVETGSCVFTLNGEIIHTGCEDSFEIEITNSGPFVIEYTYTVDNFESTYQLEGEGYEVPEIPVLSFSSAEGIINCEGCEGMSSIEWYLEGEVLTEFSGTESITPLIDGNYSVSVSNEFGCEASSEPLDVIIINLFEYSRNAHFVIYPNPTDGLFFVESESESNLLIEVFDLGGKLVWSETSYTNGRVSIQMNGLANGIYQLRISRDQDRFNTKLILNR